MRSLLIVLMALAAAVFYGIVHDQVTVRICLEYFTVGHPKIIESQSPTLLAFTWGVVATWWVGLPLGIALALASGLGKRPKLGPPDLVKPLAILLGIMATLAVVAGICGFLAARSGTIILLPPLAERVPADRHVAFITTLWMHLASYAAGVIGGITLCVKTWRRRGRLEPGK